jgi:hypothetical protein
MKYIQKRQEPASFTLWKSQISENPPYFNPGAN